MWKQSDHEVFNHLPYWRWQTFFWRESHAEKKGWKIAGRFYTGPSFLYAQVSHTWPNEVLSCTQKFQRASFSSTFFLPCPFHFFHNPRNEILLMSIRLCWRGFFYLTFQRNPLIWFVLWSQMTTAATASLPLFHALSTPGSDCDDVYECAHGYRMADSLSSMAVCLFWQKTFSYGGKVTSFATFFRVGGGGGLETKKQSLKKTSSLEVARENASQKLF